MPVFVIGLARFFLFYSLFANVLMPPSMRVAARSIICLSGILRPSCTHWRYSTSVVLLNARTIFWMQTCLVWSRVVLEWVWAKTLRCMGSRT